MRIEICNKKDCVGCFACAQVCSRGAISMELSKDGFYYPTIDDAICVNCKACVKACPIISLKPPYHYIKDSNCYSGYNKNENVRLESSSGGMFYTLSLYVLQQGGVVFGAAWTGDLKLKHIKAVDEHGLKKMLRSKYLQSDTSEAYLQVRQCLKEDRLVMFSGTPCQVAGLKSFLQGEVYDKLILVDVVCQGVPSPVIFKKFIDEVEQKYKIKVVDVVFRSKKYGWRCGLFLLLHTFDGREIEVMYDKNSYYRAFLRNYFMRESCYNCQFKSSGKGCFSDITLADFWRIGMNVPYRCESYESGVSAILTNTKKGELLFEKVKEQIIWEKREYEEFSTNGGLNVAQRPEKQNEAVAYSKTADFSSIQNKFYPYTWRNYVTDILNVYIPQQTINKIKKWIRK